MRSDVHARVLSLFWNFTVGGVAQYAALLEGVAAYAPISIRSFSVLGPKHHANYALLDQLGDKVVVNRAAAWDMVWIQRLREQLNEWRPDIVMSHGFNGHFMAHIAARLTDVPFRPVCSYHGLYHPPTPARHLVGGIYNRFTEHYIRNRACSTVAVAEHCRTYLLHRGVDPAYVDVIHNGIPDVELDREARSRLRKEWCDHPDEILIGVASRLDPVKGVSYLIDGFARIAEKHEAIKLILIGGGSLDSALRDQVDRLGLTTRVLFTGYRTDIAACLEALDIFVLPSLAEYHSIGLLEAMRAGKAIVATDVGGNTESARHGQEALIVPPADEMAIANALDALLCDYVMRDRLARNARARYLAEFTVDRMVERSAEWFMRIASIPIPCR